MEKWILKNIETGRWTRVHRDELGEPDIKGAADRLVARDTPGYFPTGVSYVPEYFRPGWKFTVEIVRSVGDLTERTGRWETFQLNPALPAGRYTGKGEKKS